jgi:aconitate hydratase
MTGTGASAFDSARATLSTAAGSLTYFRLDSLAERGLADLSRMPFTVKILLENLLRHAGNGVVRDEEIQRLAGWRASSKVEYEFPFYPSRVILQDFTGVPAAVDLAAMRSAVA